MAENTPKPDNYVISKTWDEAMNDKPASGEAELPTDLKTHGNAPRKNGGGGDK